MKAKNFDKRFDDNKQDIIDDLDCQLNAQIKNKNESMLIFLPG